MAKREPKVSEDPRPIQSVVSTDHIFIGCDGAWRRNTEVGPFLVSTRYDHPRGRFETMVFHSGVIGDSCLKECYTVCEGTSNSLREKAMNKALDSHWEITREVMLWSRNPEHLSPKYIKDTLTGFVWKIDDWGDNVVLTCVDANATIASTTESIEIPRGLIDVVAEAVHKINNQTDQTDSTDPTN
jgi:hypothetical protein